MQATPGPNDPVKTRLEGQIKDPYPKMNDEDIFMWGEIDSKLHFRFVSSETWMRWSGFGRLFQVQLL